MKKYITCSLLLAPAFFLYSQKQNITLDDIWTHYKFHPKGIDELRSTSEGDAYTVIKDTVLNNSETEQFIIEYSYETGKTIDTLLTTAELSKAGHEMRIDDYEVGKDEKNILVSTATESVYRHSTMAKYYLWNREKKSLTPLMDGKKVMYATLSPDGTRVAWVYKGDLYMMADTFHPLIHQEHGWYNSPIIHKYVTVRITKDGSDSVFNGIGDWVYEEEFVVSRAYFWSPYSQYIAYYRFDDSKVPVYSMNEYHDSLYPTVYSFRYPKAGTHNPSVSIKIYNIDDTATVTVIPPGSFEYIPRIKWTLYDYNLAVEFMNRHQDSLVLALVNKKTGESKAIFTETSNTYIEINDALTFVNNNNEFIWESDKDGYTHLYRYDMDGKMVNQITSGKWDVTDYKGMDEKTHVLYFTSAKISPVDRDLYCIKLDGKDMEKLSTRTGSNNAEFSSNYHYYINTFSNIETPSLITLHSADGKQLRVLEDNAALKDTLKHYNLGKEKFFSFTTSQGVNLNGWMITPPDFDSTKKYPVLMYVYGGPHVNTVNNSWDGSNGMWYQMLAEKGYIIASIDNRGTGERGAEFQKCTYMHLGKLETQDQIEGAKYFQSRSYVDATRVGIWGWSYGGYMAANCITQGADYFKMAISVAPVTDWEYYDSIYTERYMRTPGENREGYKDGSPINYANKVKGHYLLVAGTGDDNVHFQNTVEFVHALEKAEKPFSLMIFPDKNHGIYGGNTRHYLFTQLTNYILGNL